MRQLGGFGGILWVKPALAAILLFSFIDSVATAHWVTSGQAEEMNPLMAEILMRSPLGFIVVKALLTFFGCAILYRMAKYFMSRCAIVIIFIVYVSVCSCHLVYAVC